MVERRGGPDAFIEEAEMDRDHHQEEPETERDRRNLLALAGGAALAAAAGALPAAADQRTTGGDTLYGHGQVWNNALPDILGRLRLSFDLRVDLKTGVGFGTAKDPVHPDWNSHFSIGSVITEKRRGGETRYTMSGIVTAATNPDNVGLPVWIIAETVGDTTAIAIAIDDKDFAGAGLVVIDLIGTLLRHIFGQR
jgi:hypothetical protein